MTRYSIPSDTHPENLVTSTTENYQSEIDFSDWELRMARLVGFEEEIPPTETEQVEDSPNLKPTPSPVQPAPADPTEQPLSSNPFAKLALVGTGTLILVLFAGIFLTQLMNGSTKKPSRNNIVAPQTRSQPTTETRLEQLEGEVETLKTKLALAEQAQAVKLAQQQLRNIKPASPTPAPVQPTPRARQNVALQRTPTPVRTVYVTRVVERPAQVPQTPQPPVIPQLPPSPPQPPVANTQPTPTPTPDPLQEWARLAKLGSYGQVLVAAKPNNVNTSNPSTVQNDTPEPIVNTRTNRTPSPRTNTRYQPREETPTPVVSQASSGSSKSIPVGTSAKAVLATGVFGETSRATNSSRNESRKNVFVVRLKEPLKAADGSVVLPAKTELLTEIRSLSDQGLLQLNVVKAIIQKDGNLTERSLPESAMLINGSQGKPLVANQFSKKGSLMSRDAGQFVLGGIGKAAELFNRTESEVITTATGTVVSNRNPRRNIWAGILEGGVRTVVPQITQRNQQAISQMMQRTNVWFLPAGTEVEVYINQSLQL
ncbi:MAG: TrbI/VirB10 family protein [Chlorogloeopsis fritschii C42_A2020_084]|uniref:TrbI/VirB10 family protein n=1 Tax=Chlorogloeopsis fritschii TaxID=1124 RepID=UPI001A0D5337|nr:TrbI/VirB10 family protein [Chlorogloeopsis fritschii]MBF2005375.1 TrbI/VirB10 family protein [Chlorogloeopsis fritschii C42_A2020_084]